MSSAEEVQPSVQPSVQLAYEDNASIWLWSCEVVWRPGRVLRTEAEGLHVELEALNDPEGPSKSIFVPFKGTSGDKVPQILRRNTALVGDGALQFNDLTEVPELHEAAVLQSLDARFAQSVIYTLSGPVLLAVNPFREIKGLYGAEVLSRFLAADGEAPHVFGIARRAYNGIREHCKSQTVLISGESGAGKTETTKFVMQFLALAGAEAAGHGGVARGGQISRVEKQVLGCNPLLEAFGNATTLRNDNSSRFGKYVELQFGTAKGGFEAPPRLTGARIHAYLLETVRVIQQQPGERSFHIFYQVLAATRTPSYLAVAYAAQKDGRSTVMWSPGGGKLVKTSITEDGDEVDLGGFLNLTIQSAAYLQGTEKAPLQRSHEAEDFEETLRAMRNVGIGSHAASSIFRMLAAVLHLGNIHFYEPNSECAGVEPPKPGMDEDSQPLGMASTLLGVSLESLRKALCSKTMQAPGEQIIWMPNSLQKAEESRDSLARHIYHAIFKYLVEWTNKNIGFQEQTTFCGVLDIFGFELFEVNSFEQLCINYTNELLQQYFNTFIFSLEAALYSDEGIAWEPQDFPDNSHIVGLLHGKPHGLLMMLDEECFSVGGSSESWCNKIVKEHENQPCFDSVKHRAGTFIVHHFAGPVEYCAAGFLEKNRDQLSHDHLQCLKESNSQFVRERFVDQSRVYRAGAKEGDDSTSVPSSPAQRVVKAQRYSVSSEFRQQLQEMLDQIRSTAPHFIRCIKPNPSNQPYVDMTAPAPLPLFDRKSVAEQLRYQGVLEAITVARAGFPVRFVHAEFFKEFRCLVPRDLCAGLGDKMELVDATTVQAVMESEQVQLLLNGRAGYKDAAKKGWAIGKTRIFLKQEPFAGLRTARLQRQHESAQRLQAAHRCRVARLAFINYRWAIVRVQARSRGGAVRGDLWRQKRHKAASALQAGLQTLLVCYRCALAHKAAITAQSWVRSRQARKNYLADVARIVKIQRWLRSIVKRRRWRNVKESTTKVQRSWRGRQGRLQAKVRLFQICRLQRVARVLLTKRRDRVKWHSFREKTLSMYRTPANVQPTSWDALQDDMLSLGSQYCSKKSEVHGLKEQVASLKELIKLMEPRVLWHVRQICGGSS